MSFQLIPPLQNEPPDYLLERERKRARERLDRIATQEKIGWKKVQLMAQDLFGKTKGFSIGECKRLTEEIKKGRI